MFVYPGIIILGETFVHIINRKHLNLKSKYWKRIRGNLDMYLHYVNPAMLIGFNIAFFVYGSSMTVEEQLNEFLRSNNITH